MNDLNQIAKSGLETLYPNGLKILIGSASCGIAVGAAEVEAAVVQAVKELGIDAIVAKTGCIGFCGREPLVDIVFPNGPRVSYSNMTPEKVRELLESYTSRNDPRPDLALGRFDSEKHVSTDEVHKYPACPKDLIEVPVWSSLKFFRRQKKIILRNCGSIDPMCIDQAVARGAYRGALQAISKMTPEEVIEQVVKSELKGRGGASFPTGLKWRLTHQAEADTKYIICNADEGEPGAYMDRSVLEGDPHAVIEGMLIGAYAVGAREGYFYIRSEYPLAITILNHALAEAEKHGLLGDEIFGSGFSFRIKVRRGAGAYICGEETALIESIEGRVGEPRNRPPYPVSQGLYGKPTVVNNVKTWASVAPIISRGADWYKAIGTVNTSGTTVFSLEGAVKNPGLVEVPFGTSLREIIYDIGEGPAGDGHLKAIQAGGPSKGCIPPSMLEARIDSTGRTGSPAIMGGGGIIVLDEGTCVVDMTRFLLGFFVDESCGKCVPCREGVRQMFRMVTGICEGKSTAEDLTLLKRVAESVQMASNCGLGTMAPNPVLTGLKYFREEFEAHVHDKKCVAGVCRHLNGTKAVAGA
jgi:NADH:ubiquinone oxidoreductase subunit F (NADH-binding)/(2Fe-2S) ferredoxin